jgi:methionyl aminopeptidase
MLNEGTADTRLGKDGWVVSTADGKRSSQFEHTLAITDSGPVILTTL